MMEDRFKTYCDEDEALLHAFVDGCLDEAGERRVRVLLDADPAAREAVAAYRAQLRSLARLRKALDEVPQNPASAALVATARRTIARQHGFGRAVRALAAGVVLALLGAGTLQLALGTFGPDRGRITARVDTDLEPVVAVAGKADVPGVRAVPHLNLEFAFGDRYIPHADSPQDEGEASLAWLAGYLPGIGLDVPDLQAHGLDLIGGAILPETEAPAVRLVYGSQDGRHILVYLGVVSSDNVQAFTYMPEGMLSVNWRNGNLVFAIAGSIDSQHLIGAMQTIRRTMVRSEPEPVEVQEVSAPRAIVSGGGEAATADVAVTTVDLGAGEGDPGTIAPEPVLDPDAAGDAQSLETTPKAL